MAYMNCPDCGLSIQLRAAYLALERCPRCLARRGVATQMFVSEAPGGPPVGPAPAQTRTDAQSGADAQPHHPDGHRAPDQTA